MRSAAERPMMATSNLTPRRDNCIRVLCPKFRRSKIPKVYLMSKGLHGGFSAVKAIHPGLFE